jgi:hypothetical protein
MTTNDWIVESPGTDASILRAPDGSKWVITDELELMPADEWVARSSVSSFALAPTTPPTSQSTSRQWVSPTIGALAGAAAMYAANYWGLL